MGDCGQSPLSEIFTRRLGRRIFSGHSYVMSAVQVLYEGSVQGVGFRYTVRHVAKGFEVTGWVKNLRDGRVEMQVTGADEELRAFLEAIEQSELRAHIRKQDTKSLPDVAPMRGFEIRYD
jgi:acylphosphatase